MNQQYYQNIKERKKEKRKKIAVIIIIILLLLSLLLSIALIFLNRDEIFAQENNYEIKEKSNNEKLSYIGETENDYTELVGYGKLVITEKRPYLYLENLQSNDVYLQFDVYNKEELIYSSKLIEPGDFDSLDVNSLLEKGNYVLTYKVATFDQKTQERLLSLMQEQEITIK